MNLQPVGSEKALSSDTTVDNASMADQEAAELSASRNKPTSSFRENLEIAGAVIVLVASLTALASFSTIIRDRVNPERETIQTPAQ